ncbi:tail assembly chaperone [Streptomyces phage Wofford]|uniref:Tail assembly chaperone n=1 Tax=Streptomyces phage Wofford TaxID=2283267 RepID=A0A345M9T3_9CAUD|nr:tail assembly chaperone [Streptomyces phage Wollford]AXH67254.1 tail assembly chaperone [Streptomyces phage Wollford]
MATSVYTTEEIILQDGTEVTLKPLNIKNLRKFMKKWKEMGSIEIGEDGNSDEIVDFIIDAAQICLSSLYPDYSNKSKYEEAVDIPTVHKIIEVCAGIKLNDPELEAAAKAALMSQAVGTA